MLYSGHKDTIRFLLANGANVNATQKGGWTILHLVARIGNIVNFNNKIQSFGNKDTMRPIYKILIVFAIQVMLI